MELTIVLKDIEKCNVFNTEIIIENVDDFEDTRKKVAFEIMPIPGSRVSSFILKHFPIDIEVNWNGYLEFEKEEGWLKFNPDTETWYLSEDYNLRINASKICESSVNFVGFNLLLVPRKLIDISLSLTFKMLPRKKGFFRLLIIILIGSRLVKVIGVNHTILLRSRG